MTDDEMPTPIAAPSSSGSVSAGRASRMPIGNEKTAAISIAAREPVDAGRAAIGRDAVAEHDVEHEQRAIGEGEQVAERLARDAHVGQQIDAGHRRDQRREIARRAQARRPPAPIGPRNSIAPTVPSGSRAIAS